MALIADNLSFAYRKKSPAALTQVSISLLPGQTVGIFGPNGSGKSTLVNCMAGILQPDAGTVSIDGCRPGTVPPIQLAKRLALSAQEIPGGLPFSVEQILQMGYYPHRGFWQDRMTGETEKIGRCVELVGLQKLLPRQFNELSGGEKRRVMLARAIVQARRFLILDEPAAYLDPRRQVELFEIVRTVAASGIGILLTSHDLFMAPLFLDSAMLIHHGRIIACGAPEQALAAENIKLAFRRSIRIAWRRPGRVSADFELNELSAAKHSKSCRA